MDDVAVFLLFQCFYLFQFETIAAAVVENNTRRKREMNEESKYFLMRCDPSSVRVYKYILFRCRCLECLN